MGLWSRALTADWTSLKWLVWMSLYLLSCVFLPWFLTRTWAHQHAESVQPRLKQLFQQGELGLVSIVLATSVIWDLQKSQYMPYTVALGSVLLAVSGIMAAAVWVESYCRLSTGTRCSRDRIWRDSRNLAFMLFSMAAVTEILLDRFAKVAAQ